MTDSKPTSIVRVSETVITSTLVLVAARLVKPVMAVSLTALTYPLILIIIISVLQSNEAPAVCKTAAKRLAEMGRTKEGCVSDKRRFLSVIDSSISICSLQEIALQ